MSLFSANCCCKNVRKTLSGKWCTNRMLFINANLFRFRKDSCIWVYVYFQTFNEMIFERQLIYSLYAKQHNQIPKCRKTEREKFRYEITLSNSKWFYFMLYFIFTVSIVWFKIDFWLARKMLHSRMHLTVFVFLDFSLGEKLNGFYPFKINQQKQITVSVAKCILFRLAV